MRKEPPKKPIIRHLMADGSILHSPEELRDYELDVSKVSPVALRIIADLIMKAPVEKNDINSQGGLR